MGQALISDNPIADMRKRMRQTGQWVPAQIAGRRWAVACVSLEITQRCNLDCTLCYLSESAEQVRDFPLEEIYRRIDMIAQNYGPGTDVQVSGGEPTLRKHSELVAIVSRLTSLGLRSSLFTNGIKATRSLLQDLVAVGLNDVAFHVDMTQQRQGYATEQDLNSLRLEYINRARCLPISVFFNTTVHADNFNEIPAVTKFFIANADVVRFASFQLQAETGRGILGARDDVISNASVAQRLKRGAGVDLKFNVLSAGHHECNQAAVMLVINGQVYDAYEDVHFIQRFMHETANLRVDRGMPWRSIKSLLRAAISRPSLTLAGIQWAMQMIWKTRKNLFLARGRVYKLAVFTHNFMDACHLDPEREKACVFMAMTQDGPLSMCTYNAQRESYLLRPLQTQSGLWQPIDQRAQLEATTSSEGTIYPIKWLKGKPREMALHKLRNAGLKHQNRTIEVEETAEQ